MTLVAGSHRILR